MIRLRFSASTRTTRSAAAGPEDGGSALRV